MSVNVPVYKFETKTKSDADIYPYGFAGTSGELDDAVDALLARLKVVPAPPQAGVIRVTLDIR